MIPKESILPVSLAPYQTALITGAAQGIGRGIAEALTECNIRCVIADIELDAAHEAALAMGAQAVALDVTQPDSWAKAKREATALVGEIDILCNNAGIDLPFSNLSAVSNDAFQRVFDINVKGVFLGVTTFVDDFKARGQGYIVNTSSMNGLLPHAGSGVYSASKFAVLGLSDALRDELAPIGIGVSTLFPGLTRSRMSETKNREIAQQNPAMAEAVAANMMEPVWLGRAVVRAISRNEPYIISHPGYIEALRTRHAALDQAHGEPAQPGYGVTGSALS